MASANSSGANAERANLREEVPVLKILVLGDPGVGKSSIIHRYVKNTFAAKHKASVGVDFHLKRLSVEDQSVQLQLWDIAGQDKFGPIARVYYKDAVGVLLVYDVTRPATFETVIRWKEEVDLKVRLPITGKPVPVMLLGNKSDLDKAVTDTDQLDRFCELNRFVGWYDTSAMLNKNIDVACRGLVKRVLQNSEAFEVQKQQQSIYLPAVGNIRDKSGCCS